MDMMGMPSEYRPKRYDIVRFKHPDGRELEGEVRYLADGDCDILVYAGNFDHPEDMLYKHVPNEDVTLVYREADETRLDIEMERRYASYCAGKGRPLHKMYLSHKYLTMMALPVMFGMRKSFELRRWDEQCHALEPGDLIWFEVDGQPDEHLVAQIHSLVVAGSFGELLTNREIVDAAGFESKEEAYAALEEVYGTLGGPAVAIGLRFVSAGIDGFTEDVIDGPFDVKVGDDSYPVLWRVDGSCDCGDPDDSKPLSERPYQLSERSFGSIVNAIREYSIHDVAASRAIRRLLADATASDRSDDGLPTCELTLDGGKLIRISEQAASEIREGSIRSWNLLKLPILAPRMKHTVRMPSMTNYFGLFDLSIGDDGLICFDDDDSPFNDSGKVFFPSGLVVEMVEEIEDGFRYIALWDLDVWTDYARCQIEGFNASPERFVPQMNRLMGFSESRDIRIPLDVLEAAGLAPGVQAHLMGGIDHFEVWNRMTYESYMADCNLSEFF